ncbi:MAG: hypothetical protein AB7N91_21825 [Candidatus Tectimicrobiota bacterium]
MAGQFLCEVCFDALTDHMTEAWDGHETAVCEDCLAPPEAHPCWKDVGNTYGVAEVRVDEQGQGYVVRLRTGATVHFRWDGPLPSRKPRTS